MSRPSAFPLVCLLAIAAALAAPAAAHVAERALVMLMPTHIYIRAGLAAVALTILAVIFVRPVAFRWFFAHRPFPRPVPIPTTWISLGSLAVLVALIVVGRIGPRDPLANLLPLCIFSVWWIFLPLCQALIGDAWAHLNPWRGLHRVLGRPQFIRLPEAVGHWPAVISYAGFAAFMAVDPAPDDPDRLALVIGAYWLVHMALTCLFGTPWLDRGEGIGAVFSRLAAIAPLTRTAIATPGARVIADAPAAPLLVIVALGAASFDGLNETFWWLARLGINPLEFPGRSAVVAQNLAGLLGLISVLGAIFALATWAGLRLIGADMPLAVALPRLTATLIPIAAGYHLAHYLTSALIGVQYTAVALNDPLGRGADLLGLAGTQVTTGYLNTPDSVATIWFIQAGAIVAGHVLAVLMSHGIALKMFRSHRRAVISQLPMGAFMIAYTFFGLWILAQPTGA